MSSVGFDMPDMAEVVEFVKAWAPTALNWCIIALAASLVLRLLLALFHKRSVLLRAINWLSAVGGLVSLGGYWILTGEVPAIMQNLDATFTTTLTNVQFTVPEQLKQVNMTGLIILGVGAVLAFLSGPLGRMFSKGDGSGDFEIVIKTIGWLLSVLGALITFGVL